MVSMSLWMTLAWPGVATLMNNLGWSVQMITEYDVTTNPGGTAESDKIRSESRYLRVWVLTLSDDISHNTAAAEWPSSCPSPILSWTPGELSSYHWPLSASAVLKPDLAWPPRPPSHSVLASDLSVTRCGSTQAFCNKNHLHLTNILWCLSLHDIQTLEIKYADNFYPLRYYYY